jgi:hypothetical protein
MNAVLPPTPYPDLNQVLQTFASDLLEILGYELNGAYQQGWFDVTQRMILLDEVTAPGGLEWADSDL